MDGVEAELRRLNDNLERLLDYFLPKMADPSGKSEDSSIEVSYTDEEALAIEEIREKYGIPRPSPDRDEEEEDVLA